MTTTQQFGSRTLPLVGPLVVYSGRGGIYTRVGGELYKVTNCKMPRDKMTSFIARHPMRSFVEALELLNREDADQPKEAHL